MLFIVPAEEKHIPDILRLLVQVNMVHHLGRPDLFKGPTTKYDEAELKALLADPLHRIFVCLGEDGQVLGHAFCEWQETKETRLLQPLKTLYVDDICVEETCRRQGVGKALFDRVREEAAVPGCDHITLNVWELNPGARRFYEACGLLPLKTTMELRLKGSEDPTGP